MAPPTVKITAPTHRVPFRPIISPTRPAATDVTFATRSAKDANRGTRYVLKAPISSTATMVPTSRGPG